MRIFYFTFFTLCYSFTFSQNTFSYLGTLLLNNNTPISFSMELQKESIKKAVDGIKETKSEISGLYFENEKSFQL